MTEKPTVLVWHEHTNRSGNGWWMLTNIRGTKLATVYKRASGNWYGDIASVRGFGAVRSVAGSHLSDEAARKSVEEYLIQANYYGSRQQELTGPCTVQATVITDFGRPTEKREALTLRLTNQRETVTIGTVTLGQPATRPTGESRK